MKKWKSKLFGDNSFNFYGWIFAGILIVGLSLWYFVQSFQTNSRPSPEFFVLGGIYLMLIAHFCLNLHNYLARVAQVLEEQEDK